LIVRSGLRRVPEGKTLKIDLVVDEDRIKDIVISGDFFAYPTEAIEELEDDLKGSRVDEALDIVEKYRDKIVIVGASIDEIKDLLKELIMQEPRP